MPIGILKYKQDDGSIVELQPAGYVKTETYTAGQAEQNTRIEEVSAVAVKANADIGSWETDHPGQTISECVTSIENEVEAADAKADAADTKATNNAAKNVEQDARLDALEKPTVANFKAAIVRQYTNAVVTSLSYEIDTNGNITFKKLDLRVDVGDINIQDTTTLPSTVVLPQILGTDTAGSPYFKGLDGLSLTPTSVSYLDSIKALDIYYDETALAGKSIVGSFASVSSMNFVVR